MLQSIPRTVVGAAEEVDLQALLGTLEAGEVSRMAGAWVVPTAHQGVGDHIFSVERVLRSVTAKAQLEPTVS